MNKNIIVLGSNSFTGSYFVDKLLTKKYNVIGISRSKEYSHIFLPYKKNIHYKNFRFYKLDLNKNLNNIIDLIDIYKPFSIVNFAAQGEVRTSWNKPSDWYKTNCDSIVRLTENIIEKKYIKKFIMASTPEVYGTTKKNLNENNNYNPTTPYAASKLAGDLHLMTLFKKYRFPVMFTRSANVYGPCQQLYRIIPKSIILLKKNKKITLHSMGKTERSFIHIKDVVEATYKIMNYGRLGETYHISKVGKEISILNLIKLICKIMQKDYKKNINLTNEHFSQDKIYSLSSKLIRNNLKWNDKYELENGVIEVMNWIEDNWSIISRMSHEYVHKK